jgi:hypothetical protein
LQPLLNEYACTLAVQLSRAPEDKRALIDGKICAQADSLIAQLRAKESEMSHDHNQSTVALLIRGDMNDLIQRNISAVAVTDFMTLGHEEPLEASARMYAPNTW